MECFDGFRYTRLYQEMRTIRFELKPQGKTLENFMGSGMLDEDMHRAESYVLVKKIIDEYHKAFIERVLSDFKLKSDSDNKQDSLEEYFVYYHIKNKSEREKEVFKNIQSNLRKQIATQLTKDEAFKRIDKKELIQQDLIDFVANHPEGGREKALIEEFRNFTTYFTGFHENRKNMYSADEKSTAISYRLVNENLPKFIDNMRAFELLMTTDIAHEIPQLYQNFEEYLNVATIAEMFQLSYFNIVLTQKQIDVYNTIIGGKSLEDGYRINGLNEYINLHNQKHKENKLPFLKLLFKQILSDRNAVSWLPEKFVSDNQALKAIKEGYENLCEQVLSKHSLKSLLTSLKEYDLSGIFIRNDLQLTHISKQLFGNWSIIPNVIQTHIESITPQKKKESYEEYQARTSRLMKNNDSFSISYINECLNNAGIHANVENYFAGLGAVDNDFEQRENLFARISNAHEDVKELLNQPYPQEKNLVQDAVSIERIKRLLDAIKELQHFIKPLLGKGDEPNKDERFYGEFTALWNDFDQITPLYNMVRNYVTRKPYSIEKLKLNFQNSTLMNGWDLNKERDNTSVILRKDGLYYLAIMNKKYNRIFDQYPETSVNGSYEKMEYKLLPGPNKMLPKVFFSKSRIDEFNPSKEICENYNKGTHKKGNNFSLKDCHALIDFFKEAINKHEDWKNFGFQFSETSSYEDLSGFYREVEHQGYTISFRNISVDYVNALVEEGKLYLFQIYNKDFSPSSKGTPNMHTIYWRMLFDESNLADVVYKLNGEGEVFFRKSSIKYERPTHPANQPIKNKNANNPNKERTLAYDLIKDRRFTVDKFQLHVPITLNFKNAGVSNINPTVNEYLKANDDTHIIGIDRGERNLLSLVLINKYGEIKEQYSLNEIINEYQGQMYATNYHDLLKRKEEDRLKARQSWKSIENIKELKEGYLSQVIHRIAQLMVKYNAIVVLEDLNAGFMRGRQKVERQVYQKFEKMLIEKLNYLVDKNEDIHRPGGALHAYQLTNPFESFQKLGKQSGFLFYVPAWNTSKIDPVTGFVNLLDVKYENKDKARSFLCKFKSIRYNSEKDWFEFKFDYNDFTPKAEGTRTEWTLCTHGDRIKTYRNAEKNNNWDYQKVDLTEAFKQHFEAYHIDRNGNLKESITLQDDRGFFEGLLGLLRLTLQMRNSRTELVEDYLISPVTDKNGVFFDSRTCDDSLPKDADANGAYNIARKGLWVIKQIKKTEDLKKLKLAISNKEWLDFAQNKPYLND